MSAPRATCIVVVTAGLLEGLQGGFHLVFTYREAPATSVAPELHDLAPCYLEGLPALGWKASAPESEGRVSGGKHTMTGGGASLCEKRTNAGAVDPEGRLPGKAKRAGNAAWVWAAKKCERTEASHSCMASLTLRYGDNYNSLRRHRGICAVEGIVPKKPSRVNPRMSTEFHWRKTADATLLAPTCVPV